MPAVLIDKPPERSEAMWLSLKSYIIRERQKKKQGRSIIYNPLKLITDPIQVKSNGKRSLLLSVNAKSSSRSHQKTIAIVSKLKIANPQVLNYVYS